MANLFGDSDGLIDFDEVASVNKPQEAVVFMPWHKPRKQFVRCNQWWKHIERLLSRCDEYKGIDTIKYFGLPGSDLLDISYFSRKLLESNHAQKKLFVHGFIDSVQGKQKADMRLSELLDRKNVDSGSKVEYFNFQALADKAPLALGRIKSNGAYHLINLDFCDGVFQERTINSMMTLLAYQFNAMIGVPWLFFLTTRTDREGVARDLLARLDEIFTASLSGDEAFARATAEHRKDILALLQAKKSLSDEDITDAEFSEILQVCFVFWLLHFVHQHEARLEVVSVMKYRVHEGNDYPDMFSYAMRVTKSSVVRKDAFNMGKVVGLKVEELTAAIKERDKAKAIEILYGSLNVDLHLTEEPETMKICAQDMKQLLEEAGLNVANYEAQMGIV